MIKIVQRYCYFLLFFGFLTACDYLDWSYSEPSTEPSENFTVLTQTKPELIIRLPYQPIEAKELEDLVSVRSADGFVDGTFRWEGQVLFWTALKELLPAQTYTLRAQGSVRALGGRRLTLDVNLNFYVLTKSNTLSLSSYTWDDTEHRGPGAEGDSIISLRFSEAMDKEKTKAAISLKPQGDFDCVWNDEGTELELKQKAALKRGTRYTLVLGTRAESLTKLPLEEETRLYFWTDKDLDAPELVSIVPMYKNSSTWEAQTYGIDELEVDDALLFNFNEDLAEEDLSAYVTFEPTITGRIERLSTSSFLFVPAQPLIPEAEYTLELSQNIADLAGNTLESSHKTSLTVSTPYLSINPLPSVLEISNDPSRETSLTLNFSAVLDEVGKAKLSSVLSLAPVFPPGLARPRLRSVLWQSDTTAIFTWQDLEKSSVQATTYYRLSLLGGSDGLLSAAGYYFAETYKQVLEGDL